MTQETIDAGVMISAQIIKHDIENAPELGDDVTPEDVARIAFTSCLKESTTWMLGTEDEKFRAGCGGLLLHYFKDDDVRERIEYELQTLKSLSAAISGVPVNFGAVLREDIEPIGLLNIFKEVKGE